LATSFPATLPSELANIMCGSIFVFVGFVAGTFAAIRRQGQVRLFVWIGLWSALYGVRLLLESPMFVAVLPGRVQPHVAAIWMTIIYFLLPVATLAWLELAIGGVRLFLQAVITLSLIIALVGSLVFAVTGSNGALLVSNHVVAIIALLVLVVIVVVPRLARKYLVLPNRAVVVVGTLIFALEGLYFNVAFALHYQTAPMTGAFGLAVLLFSFGYVAVQIALSGERRLLLIENELAIAREIQASILPSGDPQIKNLCVAAAYRPMTEVAGDFYEFMFVDPYRTGVLLADVTGHGVPAALIAAMIKVAMQSVMHCANHPGEVLRNLNRILSPQLRAQLVSAAYLWLDTETRVARYSAAGHPPLLHCRNGQLQRVENNGMLLGVLPEAEYPVCDISIEPGDRFLLCTDGVTEPENAKGDSFGDVRLDQVVHAYRSRPPSEFIDKLLSEIRQWCPGPVVQHDDITLIVIDVV
jgi:sigma-B regulation protein RsbU (phosphoserine phosphatase)